jgi:hypothetical protein
VKALEVPGAFFPGASKALEKINALFGSDLNISELDSGEVLDPLDGTPGPYASEDGRSPVFVNGVRASMTATHNGQGQEVILLERIDLQVLERRTGPFPAFDARLDGNQIFGAGIVEPLRFFVEIGINGPDRARRAMKGSDGKYEMVRAEGPNFLDTDPASFVALRPKDDPAMFRVTITAKDPGLYTVYLRWFYRVAGRELRQHTSLPVLIYRED